MDDDSTRELRHLQARAYGPDADIAGDAAALRRLRELEAQLRPVLPEAPPVTLDAAARPPATATATPAAETPATATAPPTEDSPATVAPAPVRRWFFLAGVWAASLVMVAVVVAITTWSSSLVQLQPIWQGIDTQQVAVLQEDPHFISPAFFGDSEHSLRGFEDFHGLTAITGLDGWGGPPNSDDGCLFLARTADLDDSQTQSMNGPIWSACGAGGFPAALQFRVTADMPADLRERFPIGSALKFVLDGARVGVFWDGDSADPA